MTTTYNPSLRQVPRSQKAEVLPAQQEPSILVWLESTGRLKPREDAEKLEEADSEELSDLMGDSDKYEEEDDSSMMDDDD
jgi:hypothetical protein